MTSVSRAGLKAGFLGSFLLAGAQAGQAQSPVFGDIAWPYIDSYCTFMRADHDFVYDDLDTWRFVAFSNFPAEGADPLDRLFMRVNGDLREFNLASQGETDGVPQWIYRTAGDPAIEVELQLFPGEEGYESTSYEGVLLESQSGEAVDIKGDCGV